MQTFVPYPDLIETAAVLDRSRLGKQRVEVIQILKALKHNVGWAHHPATKMWSKYPNSLSYYGVTICNEWLKRGYKDTCRNKIIDLYEPIWLEPDWWKGKIHLSHQSNLIRKFPEHYLKYFPDTPNNLPYYWPL